MNRVATLGIVGALAVVVGGCTSGDEETGPVEDTNVTFTMTTALDPGTEAEHCKFVRAPAEKVFVNRDRVQYTEGSHHFLLYTTPYDEVPATQTDGTPIEYLDEEQGVFDCSQGVQLVFETTNLIGGSQNADGDSMINLPDGVGIPVEPNAVLLMNAHYINATGEVLEPEVNITLETIDEGDVQEEGGVLFWFNVFIKAAGMASSHATARCPIPHDISITNAQSHMHARGVGYVAEPVGGSADPIYVGSDWENVPVTEYNPGYDIAAESFIEWTCEYDNPEPEDIFMGARSTDEMCMMIASYYPARPEVSVCSGDPSEPQKTNFMGAEWVGQGTATCAESLECFQSSISGGGMFQVLANITECVNAADPAISPEFSAAVGCSLASFQTGKDPIAECADKFVTCQGL